MLKKMWIFAILCAMTLSSCGTTGFLGLATEESVNKRERAYAEEINGLKARLEQAVNDAEIARRNSEEAVALSQKTAAENRELAAKVAEARDLLKKTGERIDQVSKESLEKLVQARQEYLAESN
jgi:uncharacterized lipoprotein YehR (DUF1307 family)